jgi:hypothetical protein
MQRRSMPKQTSQTDNKKRTIIGVIFLLLLLVATGAWAMWKREDPQVALVRDLMAGMESIPENQRREQFGKVRDEMEKLTEEQRDMMRDEMRGRWEQRENDRMKEFFNMTAAQQTAELDKIIDRMENWRKEREKDGDQRRGRGDRGGRGDRSNNIRPQSFGTDANGSVGASSRDKSRLDRGNPENRAYRDQFRRMMAQRMKERGIQGGGVWGGRGRRG